LSQRDVILKSQCATFLIKHTTVHNRKTTVATERAINMNSDKSSGHKEEGSSRGSELLNISARTDISDLDGVEFISPDWSQVDVEYSHQSAVQRYVNSELMARANNAKFEHLGIACLSDDSEIEGKEKETQKQIEASSFRLQPRKEDKLIRLDRKGVEMFRESERTELTLSESQVISPELIQSQLSKLSEKEQLERDDYWILHNPASGTVEDFFPTRIPKKQVKAPGATRIGKNTCRMYSPTATVVLAQAGGPKAPDLNHLGSLGETSMAPHQSSSNRPLSMEAILVEEDVYAKEGPGGCSSTYHLLLFLAGMLILIAATVAIIVLIRSHDDGTRMEELPLVYDPPTAEDCTAIANGFKLKGQDDMIVEHLHVDIDVTLDSDVDLEPLLADFLEKMKQQLVPALAECPEDDRRGVRGLRLLESSNPKYIIANTHVQVESLPKASCAVGSSKSCHRVLIKLELFLKGSENVSTLKNVIHGVALKRPLMETLGLESPYSQIDVVAMYPPVEHYRKGGLCVAPSTKTGRYIYTSCGKTSSSSLRTHRKINGDAII
jgi:hypothetical protein